MLIWCFAREMYYLFRSKEQKKKMTTAEILGMGSTTASIAAMIATMVNLFK